VIYPLQFIGNTNYEHNEALTKWRMCIEQCNRTL